MLGIQQGLLKLYACHMLSIQHFGMTPQTPFSTGNSCETKFVLIKRGRNLPLLLPSFRNFHSEVKIRIISFSVSSFSSESTTFLMMLFQDFLQKSIYKIQTKKPVASSHIAYCILQHIVPFVLVEGLPVVFFLCGVRLQP